MDLLQNLYIGFSISLTPMNILYCLAGCFFGQIVGVLPGIGAPTAVALLLPMTFSINPTSAIIMFAGIYYGVAYGGTITSVLINVPGESSTVMTCIDGYQMALKGRAGASPLRGGRWFLDCWDIFCHYSNVFCTSTGQICPPLWTVRVLWSGLHVLRAAYRFRSRRAHEDDHLYADRAPHCNDRARCGEWDAQVSLVSLSYSVDLISSS